MLYNQNQLLTDSTISLWIKTIVKNSMSQLCVHNESLNQLLRVGFIWIRDVKYWTQYLPNANQTL